MNLFTFFLSLIVRCLSMYRKQNQFSLCIEILSDNLRLKNKLEVFLSIQEGLGEIKTAKKQGKELQTLSISSMKVVVKVSKSFKRQAKPLLKKFHSLHAELVVVLITIYDKGETASISDKELRKLIAGLQYE